MAGKGDCPKRLERLQPGRTSCGGLYRHRGSVHVLQRGRNIHSSPSQTSQAFPTVYWVLKNEGPGTLDEVVEQTYAWSERKRQFTPRQIRLAMDVLSSRGWVDKSATRSHA